jgi:hypothetical protein
MNDDILYYAITDHPALDERGRFSTISVCRARLSRNGHWFEHCNLPIWSHAEILYPEEVLANLSIVRVVLPKK